MMPDHYDLFLKHDAERESELLRLPVCTECGEHIQDEHCFEINDELVCKSCLNEYYRKNTEDYIN